MLGSSVFLKARKGTVATSYIHVMNTLCDGLHFEFHLFKSHWKLYTLLRRPPMNVWATISVKKHVCCSIRAKADGSLVFCWRWYVYCSAVYPHIVAFIGFQLVFASQSTWLKHAVCCTAEVELFVKCVCFRLEEDGVGEIKLSFAKLLAGGGGFGGSTEKRGSRENLHTQTDIQW